MEEEPSSGDIEAALKHLLALEFTEMGDEAQPETSDQEEESSFEEESLANTADTFGKESYPGSPSPSPVMPSPALGAPPEDLRALVAQQARTIEILEARIRDLEAQLERKQ